MNCLNLSLSFFLIALLTFIPGEGSAQKVFVVNNLKVERDIDGNTIELTTGAKVRYIGVDVPRDKYFQAMEANRQLVEGRAIRLEFDVEKKDRYGRVLAYAYVDSIFVNAWLIEEGYARFSAHPKNARHQNIFLDLEEKAKKAEAGIWAKKVNSKRKNDLQGGGDIDIENYFVYLARNGEKYHRASCRDMGSNRIPIILRKAKLNYKPCPVCKPLKPASAVK